MIGPEFWRRYFQVYDVLNLLPVYVQLLSAICQEAGSMQDDLVLDAGSGTGNLALRIREAGGRVVALDYCLQALERHRAKDRGCDAVLADLTTDLPFADDCFDKVVSNNVLYALSEGEQRAALTELQRVLKPGGKLVLANMRRGQGRLSVAVNVMSDIVQAEGLWSTMRKMAGLMPDMIRMAYYNWKLRGESRHHRFGLDEQRALLEDAGFRLVSETKLVYSGQAVLNSAHK